MFSISVALIAPWSTLRCKTLHSFRTCGKLDEFRIGTGTALCIHISTCPYAAPIDAVKRIMTALRSGGALRQLLQGHSASSAPAHRPLLTALRRPRRLWTPRPTQLGGRPVCVAHRKARPSLSGSTTEGSLHSRGGLTASATSAKTDKTYLSLDLRSINSQSLLT
jgi:hypothetical protein